MSGKNGDGIKDEVDFGVPCSHRKKNANLISIQQLLKWNYPPPTWARQKTLKKSKQLIGLVPNIVSKKSVLNKQSNVRPV